MSSGREEMFAANHVLVEAFKDNPHALFALGWDAAQAYEKVSKQSGGEQVMWDWQKRKTWLNQNG